MMPTSGPTSGPASSVVAGATTRVDVERAVLGWLRAELDDPEITSSDNFLDIGGHSLAFLRLNRFLAATYGVVLDQRTAYNETLGVAVAAAQASE